MCRFALYLGSPITISQLVTEPDHSIVNQSYRSRERVEPLNGDGFGIAWYAEEHSPEPASFRSISPAWSNLNLRHLARVTSSACILAHVRAATPGLPVTELNCHPFVWQDFAFMHNGELGEFPRYKRQLLSGLSDEAFHMIRGSTDSEHVFAWFLDRLRDEKAKYSQDSPSRLTLMTRAVMATIQDIESLRRRADVRSPASLNLAVTDGSRAVVTRYHSGGGEGANSLYHARGSAYECRDGVCRMIAGSDDARALLVASEPLSKETEWQAVPTNHLISLELGQAVQVMPISLA